MEDAAAQVTDPSRLVAVEHLRSLSPGPREAFARIAALAATVLDAPAGFVTSVDDRSCRLEAAHGMDRAVVEAPIAETLCPAVVSSSAPVLIDDARAHGLTAVHAQRIGAWAGAPLLIDGHALGTIGVLDARPRRWRRRDGDVLAGLASFAAAEVERSHALADARMDREISADAASELADALLRERRDHLRAEVLGRAAVALAEHNEAGAVLTALAESSVPLLGAWCTIHLEGTGGRTLAASAHRDAGRADALRRAAEDGWHLDEALAAVAADGAERLTAVPDELGGGSALVLALRGRDRVVATLALSSGDAAGIADPTLAATARALAAQAGVAVDNALLHDEQAEIAATLQAGLRPRALPALEGIELAARYRPAGRANEVGGDFYDVFTREEDATAGFVVGDVVGKGAAAAALTSVVRHSLRVAFLGGAGIEAGLALAGRALGDVSGDQRFCTAVYGHARAVPGGGVDVSLARAGHVPPVLVRADGATEEVDAAGGLLGPLGPPGCETVALHLRPGDALVLVTDGVTELRGEEPGTGEVVLREELGRVAAGGAGLQALVDAVEAQAVALSDGLPRDDIAVLALRAAPVA